MILSLIATAFLMTAAYQISRPAVAQTATEDTCRENLNFNLFVEALAKDGVKVRPLNADELKFLIETKGEPPVAPPYEINIAETEDNSMLVIVQKECIVSKLGPLPTFIMRGILGTTEAKSGS